MTETAVHVTENPTAEAPKTRRGGRPRSVPSYRKMIPRYLDDGIPTGEVWTEDQLGDSYEGTPPSVNGDKSEDESSFSCPTPFDVFGRDGARAKQWTVVSEH
jgi:hypothetical protein